MRFYDAQEWNMPTGWCEYAAGTQELAWVWGNYEWRGHRIGKPAGVWETEKGDIYFYRK